MWYFIYFNLHKAENPFKHINYITCYIYKAAEKQYSGRLGESIETSRPTMYLGEAPVAPKAGGDRRASCAPLLRPNPTLFHYCCYLFALYLFVANPLIYVYISEELFSKNMISELGIPIAASTFELALNAFCKRALHIKLMEIFPGRKRIQIQ